MNNFLHSKIFRGAVYTLGVIVVALVIFYAGIQVGFHKADFSSRWGENYGRNFGGPRGSSTMGLPPGDEPIGGHGTFGQVVKINLPQVVIKSTQEVEKIIVVGDNTQIRRMREIIKPADLKVGEMIVVIGAPNNSGLIDADIVRVLPPAPASRVTNTR